MTSIGSFKPNAIDPDVRIAVPEWVAKSLEAKTCRVLFEGGDGSTWANFVAWCEESSKPK